MTNALVTQLEDERRAELIKANAEYAQLVKRGNRPQRDDAKRLSVITHLLKIPLENVAGDLAALEEMKEIHAVLAQEPEARAAGKAAWGRLVKAEEDFQLVQKRHAANIQKLKIENSQCGHQIDRIKGAKEAAPLLQERHWRIFSAPKPITPEIKRSAFSKAATETALADAPLRVKFPHTGHGSVTAVLSQQGYAKVTGTVDVWELTGPAPKAKAKKKRATKAARTGANNGKESTQVVKAVG